MVAPSRWDVDKWLQPEMDAQRGLAGHYCEWRSGVHGVCHHRLWPCTRSCVASSLKQAGGASRAAVSRREVETGGGESVVAP